MELNQGRGLRAHYLFASLDVKIQVGLGFTLEFIKNGLGPCLLNKKSRSDDDIKEAAEV